MAGSCAALVAICCGRKVALFTSLYGGHVVWSNCDFSVLIGPTCSTMFLLHVRTRLDGRRNYFRIYMIYPVLISDRVRYYVH